MYILLQGVGSSVVDVGGLRSEGSLSVICTITIECLALQNDSVVALAFILNPCIEVDRLWHIEYSVKSVSSYILVCCGVSGKREEPMFQTHSGREETALVISL